MYWRESQIKSRLDKQIISPAFPLFITQLQRYNNHIKQLKSPIFKLMLFSVKNYVIDFYNLPFIGDVYLKSILSPYLVNLPPQSNYLSFVALVLS